MHQLQERGRQLEGIIYSLLELEGLRPRRNMRSPVEEVDLFFTDGLRHFLMEVKWKQRVGVADIFALRGKLEGRLAGTLGIFLDAGGALSQEAIHTLTWGRQINCLLFDGDDLHRALQPQQSFRKILDIKLRYAACYGRLIIPYRTFEDMKEIAP